MTGQVTAQPQAALSGGLTVGPSSSDTEDRWRRRACRFPMAELPAAALSEVAASERDVLLATKLHVPGSRPGLVPRPRLAELLDEGLGRGVVLVCAPAGYGKTVLLAEWAQHGRFPAAWLSLDPGDNDPARFWRHVVAALERVRPGITGRVGPLLGPPAPPSFEGLVTALINELAAPPGDDEALLVLDDYHVIDSEPVHGSLGFLLEHRPPGLDLVLASRSDPPLALARLRARGQLAELRAAELRFTADETATLLQQMAAGTGAALTPMQTWRRYDSAHRGVGGRAAASRPVAARPARRRGVRGGVHRQPPLRPGLTWPRRCSTTRTRGPYLPAGNLGAGSARPAHCATRSPAGSVARPCWSGSSGRVCSWCRSMRSVAGGVITRCSPTCSAPVCGRNSPAMSRCCTATRRPGMRGARPG